MTGWMIYLMKFKTTIASLSLSLVGLTHSQALLITDFSEPGFQVYDDLTSVSIERHPTYLLASGSSFSGAFAGFFESVDIGGFSEISLTGRVVGENPNMQFSIYLLHDEAMGQWLVYEGYTDVFGSSSTTFTLSFAGGEGAPFTGVTGLMFVAGGDLGSDFSFAFESLQAVPEPSVYALSAVALGVAAWLRRRRWSA